MKNRLCYGDIFKILFITLPLSLYSNPVKLDMLDDIFSLDLDSLQNISVVSGSKMNQPLKDVPANIEVAKFLGFKNIFPSSMLGYESSSKVYSVDPNVIKVAKNGELKTDYVFEGIVDECMGIVDHYKLFVKVKQYQFFIKILKRDYEGCYADRTKIIQIGFDKKDISFI